MLQLQVAFFKELFACLHKNILKRSNLTRKNQEKKLRIALCYSLLSVFYFYFFRQASNIFHEVR